MDDPKSGIQIHQGPVNYQHFPQIWIRTRNIFHTNVIHLFDLFDRLRLDIELLRTQRID